MYDRSLANRARYIGLNHDADADTAGVEGLRAVDVRADGRSRHRQPYTYAKDGFEATHYDISTDQFGTQLDPPAHWAPEYPAIDELPATFAVRPLVVISIVDQVKKKGDYHLQVADIQKWEKAHGRIPEGSVVMVRSDWSKKWTTDPVEGQGARRRPGVPGRVAGRDQVPPAQAPHPVPRPRAAGHGHDADARGRGVADAPRLHAGRGRRQPRQGARDRLPGQHRLPEVRAAGLGGYASYIAICPPGVKGAKISRADAPLKKQLKLLHWDATAGMRVR